MSQSTNSTVFRVPDGWMFVKGPPDAPKKWTVKHKIGFRDHKYLPLRSFDVFFVSFCRRRIIILISISWSGRKEEFPERGEAASAKKEVNVKTGLDIYDNWSEISLHIHRRSCRRGKLSVSSKESKKIRNNWNKQNEIVNKTKQQVIEHEWN